MKRIGTHLKHFFATEFHDLKDQQKVTAGQTGYQSANAAIDITHDLDSLANAATFDQSIVSALTDTNITLTEENSALVEDNKSHSQQVKDGVTYIKSLSTLLN